MVAGFFLSMNHASAQRYRSRNQNQDEEQKVTQDSLDNETFGQRLVKGANFQLGFGGDYTLIDVSPVLGYRLTPKLQAGIGFSYIYMNQLNYYQDPITGVVTTSWQAGAAYGGRVYAEYDITNKILRNSMIFAHFDLEDLNVPYQDQTTYVWTRYWLQSPYIGLGVRVPIGPKVLINATIAFNANYNQYAQYNPFPQIIEKIGFTF